MTHQYKALHGYGHGKPGGHTSGHVRYEVTVRVQQTEHTISVTLRQPGQ